jgi:hypothetical protein
MKKDFDDEPSAPYVHLGERLLAVGRIREGLSTAAQAAVDLGVRADEVRQWQVLYASDRTRSLKEFRQPGTPENWSLEMRARRLAALIADAERDLRVLNRELFASLGGSGAPGEPAEPLGPSSKKLA